LSAPRVLIWPSTPLPLDLACRLTGAVLGFEGEKVFPEVLKPPTWDPPQRLLLSVKQSILQEKARSTDSKEFKKLVESKPTTAMGVHELRTGGLVTEVLSAVRGQSNVVVSAMSQLSLAAGWCISSNWVQVSGRVDMCLYGSKILPALETHSFASGPVSAPTQKDFEILRASLANKNTRNGPVEFVAGITGGAPLPGIIGVIDHKFGDPKPMDSQGLLYSVAALINQVIQNNIDHPVTNYTIITNGQLWRFIAFQLNTLDFQSAATPNGTKNAAWVYESQLYDETRGEVVLHVEPLRVLRGILERTMAIETMI